MRIQLDNYEANLTDVNEKMQYTNHVLKYRGCCAYFIAVNLIIASNLWHRNE